MVTDTKEGKDAVLHLLANFKNGKRRNDKCNVISPGYRDLRARLELAVDHMLDACSQVECVSTTTGASTDDEPEFLMKSPRVTTIARKQLATAVRDLMQHGLIQASAFGLWASSKSKSSLLLSS